MKMRVLSIDGLERAAQAWRFSRDLGTEATWEEVFDVDVPVNELPSVVVNFTGMTIIEREIFFSHRTHAAWARTSHVDDPLKFTVPEELAIHPEWLEERRELMRAGRAAGQSQDEWRFHLPTISETAWTQRISFRDLVKIAAYFDHLAEVENDQLCDRFDGVSGQLHEIVDRFTGDRSLSKKAIKSYSKLALLREGSLEKREPRIVTPGLFVLQMTVPLWLRAQIVRHRGLTFVDDFHAGFIAHPDALLRTIGEPVTMEIAVTQDQWRSIMSKRSCWIAQDSLAIGRRDAWQELIETFGWTPEMLPCHDGHCPYHKDAGLRLTPADPGAPCPRYLTIEGIDHAPYRERIVAALPSRNAFWKDQVR